jgi:uncharacterized protein YdeI (YjbR/CyaY-like superfamily)
MGSRQLNPKIDDYIFRAQPFAKPILAHLRKLVHKACPEVAETIKWSRPFFEYRGSILCNMSAFKQHCSLGFWGEEIGDVLRKANAAKDGAMGSLGRITSLKDLPSDALLLDWMRKAATFIATGNYTSPIAARQTVVKPPRPVPQPIPEFKAKLEANKKASAVFATFSPSCRREYIDWIGEAKRAETRNKRIDTAVEWIAEGKQRNWKYQNC